MSRLEEEYNNRKRKSDALRAQGSDPYPARCTRTHTIAEVQSQDEQLIRSGAPISIVGRVMGIRQHGGSTFITLRDGSGSLQAYFKSDHITRAKYDQFTALVDIGDFLGITGSLFRTKRGELTVLADSFSVLTKALYPLPEKWHGLSDTEIRYRKRYLDLISNQAVADTFAKRAQILKILRTYVEDAGFMEVDTPVLQSIPGGATARPFITHHNALDTDLYLRVAPELYLKRLIIGGFEKVYEIARCFRNEGIDRDHNPEFTQIELYAAYWDYQKMMTFTEGLVSHLVETLYGRLTHIIDGIEINFTPPFEQIRFRDALQRFAGVDIDTADDKSLLNTLKQQDIDIDPRSSRAKLLDELLKESVRPALTNPTFITEYPIELSPLAKKIPGDEGYVERFQLMVAHRELCNAFSELNDPIDQAERFRAQEELRAHGDDEAQRIDEDFIEALSHGMPPTAGIGIGIDRLVALLTDTHNLKEVILFPTLKPKTDHDENQS